MASFIIIFFFLELLAVNSGFQDSTEHNLKSFVLCQLTFQKRGVCTVSPKQQ
jgi:hypothetical protein